MKELLNTTVKKIYISADKTRLVFDIEDKWGNKTIFYECYGDCCSESWFYSIQGISNLLGEKVVGVELREEKEVEPSGKRQDSDQAYGYTLKTKKGCCDIEFRNSSNGYYGGECSRGMEYKPNKDDDLQEVTNDSEWL